MNPKRQTLCEVAEYRKWVKRCRSVCVEKETVFYGYVQHDNI